MALLLDKPNFHVGIAKVNVEMYSIVVQRQTVRKMETAEIFDDDIQQWLETTGLYFALQDLTISAHSNTKHQHMYMYACCIFEYSLILPPTHPPSSSSQRPPVPSSLSLISPTLSAVSPALSVALPLCMYVPVIVKTHAKDCTEL